MPAGSNRPESGEMRGCAPKPLDTTVGGRRDSGANVIGPSLPVGTSWGVIGGRVRPE